jgi:hypothetical protein
MSLKTKPEKHHYGIAISITLVIAVIAAAIYFLTSFSSVQESVNKLEALPNVDKVTYSGEGNKLVVRCVNGKELEIELEDSLERFEPVISDFCR